MNGGYWHFSLCYVLSYWMKKSFAGLEKWIVSISNVPLYSIIFSSRNIPISFLPEKMVICWLCSLLSSDSEFFKLIISANFWWLNVESCIFSSSIVKIEKVVFSSMMWNKVCKTRIYMWKKFEMLLCTCCVVHIFWDSLK